MGSSDKMMQGDGDRQRSERATLRALLHTMQDECGVNRDSLSDGGRDVWDRAVAIAGDGAEETDGFLRAAIAGHPGIVRCVWERRLSGMDGAPFLHVHAIIRDGYDPVSTCRAVEDDVVSALAHEFAFIVVHPRTEKEQSVIERGL